MSEGGSYTQTGAAGGNYKGWLELFGLKSGHERRKARKERRLRQAAMQFARLGTGSYRAPGAVASVTPPGRVYSVQPGSQSSTGTQAPSAPAGGSTGYPWLDRLLYDLGLGAQFAGSLLDWLASRKGSGDGAGAFPPFTVTIPGQAPGGDAGMATFLGYSGQPGAVPNIVSGAVMPSVNTGSIWGTLGSALGQLGMGALQQLGSGPMAMPGGAPIMGIGGGSSILPTVPGTTTMRVRAPSIIVANGRAYRSLGTPIAWSGDLSAVKRLRRAAQRISHVIPHRRSYGRFR